MPSTRRQKAEASKSREMDMISDLDNLEIIIGNENKNPIEREVTNTIEGSVNQFDNESNSYPIGNSSQKNEFRDFGNENAIPRQDRFLECMETFTKETTLRLSQEMDSTMSMMHSQINRATNSATAERVIPEFKVW